MNELALQSTYTTYRLELVDASTTVLAKYAEQWEKAGFFRRLAYQLNLVTDIRERSRAARDTLDERIRMLSNRR